MERLKEVPAFKVNGFVALIVLAALAILGFWQAKPAIEALTAALARGVEIVIRRQEAGGRRQEVGFWSTLVLPPKTFPLQRGGLYPVGEGQFF